MKRLLGFLFAAAVITACGGTTTSTFGSSSIALSGNETLTVFSGAGGNGLPGCPAANGVVSATKVVVNLGSHTVERTISTVDCAATTNPYNGLTSDNQTTTVTASAAQIAALVAAVQALEPHHIDQCGEDGSDHFLTVDHGGGDSQEVDDEGGSHCPPVVATVSVDAMAKVLALSQAAF